jgi:hypothetical protein
MSELINQSNDGKNLHLLLLSTTSAIVLCAAVATAQAEEGDHPTVWIELGGQLTHLNDSQQIFTPVFPNSPQRPSIFLPSESYEGLPPNSVDESGKLTFEPKGSDWVFSASVRYGRSNAKRDKHQQTYPNRTYFHYYFGGINHTETAKPIAARFADTSVRTDETHFVLDFQAGKDVGLGLFGSNSASVFNVGVRFAQFSSRSNITIKSDPDWHRNYKYLSYPALHITHEKKAYGSPYHTNAARQSAARSFHGIGPSISWNASAPIMGSPQKAEVSVDWGINAALLFGRQRAKVHHQTTAQYHTAYAVTGQRQVTFQGPVTPDHSRSRTVTIPNVGGFAGATYRIENFKFSAGYKADFFFGAMDGGVDAARKEDIGFYGPFAVISIGLGG